MSDHLLDAQDAFSIARDLVELIAMTARHQPDSEQAAISAGCAAALDRLDAGLALLKQAKEGGQ